MGEVNAHQLEGAAMARSWSVEHTYRNVSTIVFQAPHRGGWEQWMLVSSDRHHDNAKCDQRMERRHLDQARDRDAPVIDAGDLFCAMQGKWDKRADRSAMREEYQQGPYLDRLVSEAAKFYGPYADLFAVIGRGNHETSIAKYHETDLTERLVALLNENHGGKVLAGGYGGWVRLQFRRQKEHRSKLLHYYHGTGGGGPVTADMIQLDRMRNRADADIYVFGHTHDSWCRRISVAGLTSCGRPMQREIIAVKCPSYKDAYHDGAGGYEIEKGHPPKPLGAWWLRFTWHRTDGICVEAMEAK